MGSNPGPGTRLVRALLQPHPAQLLTMDVFLVTCLCSIPFMESYVKCKNLFYFILSTRGRQTMGEVQSCFDIHYQLIQIDLGCIFYTCFCTHRI